MGKITIFVEKKNILWKTLYGYYVRFPRSDVYMISYKSEKIKINKYQLEFLLRAYKRVYRTSYKSLFESLKGEKNIPFHKIKEDREVINFANFTMGKVSKHIWEYILHADEINNR